MCWVTFSAPPRAWAKPRLTSRRPSSSFFPLKPPLPPPLPPLPPPLPPRYPVPPIPSPSTRPLPPFVPVCSGLPPRRALQRIARMQRSALPVLRAEGGVRVQGRAGCGRTARNCAHIPRVQWVAASAAPLPATRHAALASRPRGRCSCPSAPARATPPAKIPPQFLGGAGGAGCPAGELAHRGTPPRADVCRRPRAGRALQQVLLSDTVVCSQRIVISE